MLNCLIVLYKNKCDDSPACTALNSFCRSRDTGNHDSGINVLIFDNGGNNAANRSCCNERGWVYLGGMGNLGLSRAYSSASDYLINANCDGSLVLLDEDTVPTERYLNRCLALDEKDSSADVFFPILMQDSKILSPWREKALPYRRFLKSSEECISEKPDLLYAFNSGMLIKNRVFRKKLWDNRLFMDGVDISFLDTVRGLGFKTAVIDTCLKHEFSGHREQSADAAMTRFSIYIKDMRHMYNRTIKYYYLTVKRALHLSAIYRSAEPFRILTETRSDDVNGEKQ